MSTSDGALSLLAPTVTIMLLSAADDAIDTLPLSMLMLAPNQASWRTRRVSQCKPHLNSRTRSDGSDLRRDDADQVDDCAGDDTHQTGRLTEMSGANTPAAARQRPGDDSLIIQRRSRLDGALGVASLHAGDPLLRLYDTLDSPPPRLTGRRWH